MTAISLIFDFDGTLVDSFKAVILKFNFLAKEFGFTKVDEDGIEALKNLNSKELIHHFRIPLYKIPEVLLKIRKEIKSEMHFLKVFQGLPEVLQTLSQRGLALGVLTSNSIENASQWLKSNHLDKLFRFVHSEPTLFGKSRMLKKILKANEIDQERAFYIGDETRDIEAAHESGIHSIAVTWGFNSEKILLEHRPSYLARVPEDLLKICTGASTDLGTNF